MSSDPDDKPTAAEAKGAGDAPDRPVGVAPEAARTVPGTYQATDDDEEDDDRDTLRAPPRTDQTPTVIPRLEQDAFRSAAGLLPAPLGSLPVSAPLLARVALRSVAAQMPAPQPIGRISLPAVELPSSLHDPRSAGLPSPPPAFPPAMPTEAAPGAAVAKPPPLPVRGTRESPKPPPMPPLLQAAPEREESAGEPPLPNLDDIPTLKPDSIEAPDAGDERNAEVRRVPSEPFLGAREIRIPPLPVPKDLPKLLELELEREREGRDSTRPSVNELLPPDYASTLSPAERAARWAEPRAERERGRGRLVVGLAIAAAGVLVIGGSALWQSVAEPVVPKRTAAAAAHAPDAPVSAPEPPSAAPITAPSTPPSTPTPAPSDAIAAREEPTPAPTLAPAPPRARPAIARKRPPATPAIDPATLPEAPSRQAVIDALAPLREEIGRCSGGRGGVAEIMLTVDGSGAVRHASLVGDYAGTPQGSCIALAARKARFSPFRQERFSVRYPVAL